MFELIKKSLLASLGAAVVTKEKIQEATNLLVREGKITAEEAERLAEDVISGGKRQWEDIQRNVSDLVKKGMDNLDLGSKREFQELQTRVENLERRLAILETAPKKAPDEGIVRGY